MRFGQCPLAALFVGEREQGDGDTARSAVAVLGRHLVVGSAVGVAGEELVAVDPVLQFTPPARLPLPGRTRASTS